MSQHRTPFTTSRFVTNPAEHDSAQAFEFRSNFQHSAQPTHAQPTYNAPSVLLGPASTEQSQSYSPDRTPRYNESADQAPIRPRTRQEDRHRRSAPKTKKAFGLLPTTHEDQAAQPGTYSFLTVSGDRIAFPVQQDADEQHTADSETAPVRRGGAHRLPAPPAALKGRAAVVAVAAGAVVAAGQAALDNGPAKTTQSTDATLAASTVGATAAPQAAKFMGTSDDVANAAVNSGAPQVLNIAAPTDLSEFSNLLAKGQKFAQERAAEEAAKLRPLFSTFSHGTFTSGFGARWGTLHAGVDLANAIGTPILAVADGEVIDAGPASGFGMWVRLKHADGTVTVYGHIDSATVSVGQHVLAGDEIAKMGNRGFSTGPHCHFEVWLNGKDKVDPLPWLASRGISLGQERD